MMAGTHDHKNKLTLVVQLEESEELLEYIYTQIQDMRKLYVARSLPPDEKILDELDERIRTLLGKLNS